MKKFAIWIGLLTITTVVSSGCAGTSPSEATTSPSVTATVSSGMCKGSAPPATYRHVVWIWMENKNASDLAHSADAPFLGNVATTCGSSTRYTDLGVHPSEPNYIAATSGSTNGIHDDADATRNAIDADNVFRQVRSAGLTTKTYAEDMPTNCAQASSGKYASKHNPESFYRSPEDHNACQNDNVPMTQFSDDLNHDHLANFVNIIPNLCNDMHNCSVSTGDAWLHNIVDQITTSPTYKSEPTAIFVLFDESEGTRSMPFFAIAPSITPGTQPGASFNHFSTLRATEEMLGLQTFLGKANDNPGLRAAFHL